MGSVDLHGVKDKAAAKQIMKDALDSIPEEVLQEMAQLVKANSIEGCKAASVDIVYTPFLNLKKEERMDVGQVGFKDEAFRLLIRNVERDREAVKAIEKTKEEREVNLAEELDKRNAEERAKRKKIAADKAREERELAAKRAEEKALREYSSLSGLEGTSNKD